MIRLDIGSASLVGKVRSANEDAVLVADGLAAVADGMGGHRAGEVASADTVDVLRSVEGTRSLEDLVRAVHLANRRISERAEEDAELRGMGTTVCVVGLIRRDDRDEIAVLNVGDSRVYLLADATMRQLTEDHSLVGALVREGRISEEEANSHPQRNVLTRALGIEPLVVVDAWLLLPRDGDRLLLCSDGLTNELDDDRIAEILGEGEPPEVTARRLAAEADAAGGRDNTSAVVVDVVDSGSPPAPLGDRFRRITTPAVDLSEDDAGPHTETVLAVVSPGDANGSGTAGAGDAVAGPSEPIGIPEAPVVGDAGIAALAAESATDDDDDRDEHLAAAHAEAAVAVARAARWRTAAFVLAVVVVVGLALGAIFYTARQGWYVAAAHGEVTLYQGTPVLWINPSEVRGTGVQVDQLTPADQARVKRGTQFPTRRDAEAMISNLATTSTTTTTTTTTVAPTTLTAPPTTVATAPPATLPAATGPAAPPGP